MKINKNYLNYLLKEKKITKEQICSKLNITVSALNQKIRNERKFNFEEILTITIMINEPFEKIFYKEYEHKKKELKEKNYAS